MSEAVLDASALMCVLKGETGADQVIAVLPRCVISAVNLSEVIAKLSEAGVTDGKIGQALGAIDLTVVSFDSEQASVAGLMRGATRKLGLSFGDRACLALARSRKATALTADRAWAGLTETLGITVQVIR